MFEIFHHKTVQAISSWIGILAALFTVIGKLTPQWFGTLTWPQSILLGIALALAASLVIAVALAIFAWGFRLLRPLRPAAAPLDLDYQPSQIDFSQHKIAERLETVEQVKDEVSQLRDQLGEMAKVVGGIMKTQAEMNDSFSDQIKAARDYATGASAGLSSQLQEMSERTIHWFDQNAETRDKIEAWIVKIRDDFTQRLEFIDQGFAAILDRERLLQLAASIEAVGEELSGPTRGEQMGDKDAWAAKFGEWQKDLDDWSRIAATYRVGTFERVHDTPKSEYRGKWHATDNLFPDSIAVHDYKTFRIMLRNFYVERKSVENCVQMAAFAHPSMKGRSQVQRDKNQMPRGPKECL